MTMPFTAASSQVAAGAAQEPALLRRVFDALTEARRDKANRTIAEYLSGTEAGNKYWGDNTFRLGLERGLLGQ